MGECHADATVLIATGIIGRPVNRVDYPYIFVRQVRKVLLLAEESAPRKKFPEFIRQKLLDGKVRARHQVLHASFLLHRKPFPDHQVRRLPHYGDYLVYCDGHNNPHFCPISQHFHKLFSNLAKIWRKKGLKNAR